MTSLNGKKFIIKQNLIHFPEINYIPESFPLILNQTIEEIIYHGERNEEERWIG